MASPWLSCANRAERDAVPSSFTLSVSQIGGGPGGGGGGDRHDPLVRTDLIDMGDATGPCLGETEISLHTAFDRTSYYDNSHLVTSLNGLSLSLGSCRLRRVFGTAIKCSTTLFPCIKAGKTEKTQSTVLTYCRTNPSKTFLSSACQDWC